MKIVVTDQVHLAEFRSLDKNALIEHLNERDLYDRTLRIGTNDAINLSRFLAGKIALRQHDQPRT